MITTKQTISHLIESNNIFLCDFNDSFTYNIYSDLVIRSQSVVLKSFDDEIFWNNLLKKNQKFILILGPGPGHPDDYSFAIFKKFLDLEICFVLGICLGHQLLLNSFGAKIKASSHKIHGQQVHIMDKEGEIFNLGFNSSFQRYNSLTADISSIRINSYRALFDSNNELMVFKTNRLLSCQFHPESVGTNCPNSIYNIALKFLL